MLCYIISPETIMNIVFSEYNECPTKKCAKEISNVRKSPYIAKVEDLTTKMLEKKISASTFQSKIDRIQKAMQSSKEVKEVASCMTKKCMGILRKDIAEFLKVAKPDIENINKKSKKTKADQDMLDIVSKLKSVQSKLDDNKLTNVQRLAAIKNARS